MEEYTSRAREAAGGSRPAAASRPLTAGEFWDRRHAAVGLPAVFPRPRESFLDFELDRLFQKHLAGRQGQAILEVGCGSSVWLPYFRRVFGLAVTGVDYSEAGLKNARRILDANREAADLVAGDFFDLSEALGGRFDILFSLGLVEHFGDPASALRTLGRFLRPGGTVITWTPNTLGWPLRLSRRWNAELEDFYADLDGPALARHHREAGFEVLDSRYVQFLDLSLVRVKGPSVLRRAFYRLAKAGAWPFLWAKRRAGVSIPSRRLSSGLVVVGVKR